MSLVPTLSSLGFPLHAALYCSYRAYWLSDGDVYETRQCLLSGGERRAPLVVRRP